MESNKNADLNALNIVAYSLMAGLALFCGIVYYLNTTGAGVANGPLVSPQTDLLIVGGVGLAGLMMSRFLSGKLLESATDEVKRDYPQAMSSYRSAKIARLALLEAPGLFAAVFALITGNLSMLLVGLFMLAMMWIAKPSEAEFSGWRGQG